MPSNKNTNNVTAIISKEIFNKISKIADNERRSISQTTSILLEKAIDSLKKNENYNYLFIDDEK